MRKAIISVSHGEAAKRQSVKMLEGFLEHNPEWEPLEYSDRRLDSILPSSWRTASPFNKCEIGRWFALREALATYDRVLYSDNDVRWYGEYATGEGAIVLSPHFITGEARKSARFQIHKDGFVNLGVIEMGRHPDAEMLFDFILRGACLGTSYHGSLLWLQSLASDIRDIGAEASCNMNPGVNVALWNLEHGDRSLSEDHDGRLTVACGGTTVPLVSFHFSKYGFSRLFGMGGAVSRLAGRYASEQTAPQKRP